MSSISFPYPARFQAAATERSTPWTKPLYGTMRNLKLLRVTDHWHHLKRFLLVIAAFQFPGKCVKRPYVPKGLVVLTAIQGRNLLLMKFAQNKNFHTKLNFKINYKSATFIITISWSFGIRQDSEWFRTKSKATARDTTAESLYLLSGPLLSAQPLFGGQRPNSRKNCLLYNVTKTSIQRPPL